VHTYTPHSFLLSCTFPAIPRGAQFRGLAADSSAELKSSRPTYMRYSQRMARNEKFQWLHRIPTTFLRLFSFRSTVVRQSTEEIRSSGGGRSFRNSVIRWQFRGCVVAGWYFARRPVRTDSSFSPGSGGRGAICFPGYVTGAVRVLHRRWRTLIKSLGE